MKPSLLLLPLCCIATLTQPVDAASPTHEKNQDSTLQVEPYTYGTKLDIVKIISIEEPQDRLVCEVVTAKMIYLDSANRRRALTYLKMASGCSDRS